MPAVYLGRLHCRDGENLQPTAGKMTISYAVITICLNAEATLSRTIESVLSQTPAPLEYIFVDGGSTDGTLEIIRAHVRRAGAERSPVRFRELHQKEGGGIAQAWNIGLDAVSADVVFILNSDDWYEAGTARYVTGRLKRSPGIGIFLGAASRHRPEDHGKRDIKAPKPLICFPFMMPAVHPACFVRKSVYDRIGRFDERYQVAADYDFLYRCRTAGIRFQRSRRVLVNMEMGGFASRNRKVSRKELYRIAARYERLSFLPFLAYLSRVVHEFLRYREPPTG
jgi:glycosyltransferase involved in cell wall biosynthesis